jgi:hypothetical protein
MAAHPVIWLLFVLMLVLVVDQLAEASGDRIKQSNDVGGDDSVGVAFGHALGDVDINDCLASTQWGTILVSKQVVILNKWCAAEVYDAKGLPGMAARMRCDIPEVRKHFNTDNGCIFANTAKIPVEPAEEVSTPDDDDEQRYHEALEARLAAIEAQSSKDTERARRAARAAQVAAEEAQRVEQERKEYAQQTLEQLQEYRK